ncbi:hypothetical protein PAMA_017616 [Pampus argenteus]
MLAEGFLRILRYREERKFASASKRHKTQAHTRRTDLLNSADLHASSAEAGPNQEELDYTHANGLRALPEGTKGLSIPGCPPVFTPVPDLAVCLDSCSLLEEYPDLQVADSGLITYSPLRPTQPNAPEVCAAQQQPQNQPLSSMPDQGYLVMGPTVNINLDLSDSGLEPMSNSLLNGLLDRQLEEVYLQHLTDNLARCNSHLGSSLLHGLVPPPQPSSEPQHPDSLEARLEEESRGEIDKRVNYLSTQNLTPCSSNFSSPVLRISELETTAAKHEDKYQENILRYGN